MDTIVKIKWKGKEEEVSLSRPSFMQRNSAARKSRVDMVRPDGSKGQEIDDILFKECMLKECITKGPEGFDISSKELDFTEGDKLFEALQGLLSLSKEEEKKL